MKQVTDTSKAIWENELQALKNALISLNLKGYEVWVNHNGFRGKKTFLLRDDTGTALTGSCSYDRLNHFIMGYGKALKSLSEHPQPTESIKSTVTSEIISTHNSGMLAAMEFGYRECEKGNNLDMAFINFNKALKNK